MGLNDINTHEFETYDNPDGTTTSAVEHHARLKAVEKQNSSSSSSGHGVVLPDRVQNKVVKGADHPSFFAKGCDHNDTTPGGAYINNDNTGNGDMNSNNNNSVNGSSGRVTEGIEEHLTGVAHGWKAATVDEQTGLFVPTERDDGTEEKEEREEEFTGNQNPFPSAVHGAASRPCWLASAKYEMTIS